MSLLPSPDGFTNPTKTQGVRWNFFYRSITKGTENRYNAKCGFCLCDVEGRPERLHNHVMNCKSLPLSEKKLYLQNVTKESSESVQHKRPREEVVSPSSTKQQTMLSWVSRPMSSEKINEQDELLLKALINGGVSFTPGDNIFFKRFVQSLSSSYKVSSSETLRRRILTELFSKHLQKKLAYLPSFIYFTICFDGWTDISSNSIYAFMVLKKEREDVLDSIDLSEVRHTVLELKEQLLLDLLRNGALVGNVLACVTDSPLTMVKLRNDLRALHPNVIHIHCCLHAFNLLAKDIAGCKEVLKEEKKIPHFLSTFCETRWYSLSRVCLGVAAYEEGFRHCLELSKQPGYPQITNLEVRNTIMNRYHFADNECLVEAFKPIIDVIGKLERRTTTLDDELKSFITLYHNAKISYYAIRVLKSHILCAIGKRVKEFEDPIYFLALFLHPLCKTMTMSRMMTGEKIIRAALEVAKVWHFSKRDVVLLYNELINYKNGDAPYDDLKQACNIGPARDFWEKFCGGSPLLRRFATKVFAIVPNSGPCERLFSVLGLIKSKPRNRLEVQSLNMLGQIKCDLTSEVCTKKIKSVASHNMEDGLSMSYFDIEIEDGSGNDLLDEEIDEVQFADEDRTMEDFFDFDAFEHDNLFLAPETTIVPILQIHLRKTMEMEN